MPDREKDKETLRIDRPPGDADPNDTLRIDRSAKAPPEDDDKTSPSAPPVRVNPSEEATAPAAAPLKLSEEPTAPAAAPLQLDKEDTAPAASPVKLPAAAPNAPASTWRRTLSRAATILALLGVVLLLPTLVAQIRSLRAAREVAVPPPLDPVEDVELPPDPPLSAEIQDLLRRGRAAEDAMRLHEARLLYGKAAQLERKCSTCQLRLAVVERRIEAFAFQALEDGNRYLDDARYDEAAKSFQKVLDLVPHKDAKFNILAKAGLDDARTAAKKAGRPIP